MNRTTRCLIVAAFLSLALTACKKPGEAAAEAAIKAATGADATVEQNADNSTTTIKTKDGELKLQSGDNISLPTDFPKDVYLPSGYTLTNVMNMGPMHSVVMELPGQTPALTKEITSKMEAGGWSTALSMNSGAQGAMLSFTNEKSKRTATYSLSPSQDGKLTLSVQHTEEQKK